MNKCKNCGGDITQHSLVDGFCSTKCFWEFEDGKKSEVEIKVENASITTHLNIIKKVIKRNKKFFIHRKTLNPYLGLKMFDNFLSKNDLMVTNLDDELSVIKKSII